MPEIPELTVIQELINRRIPGHTIVSAEVIPPGSPIVVRSRAVQAAASLAR